MLVGVDPVEQGLVASLARPGGNITGLTVTTTAMTQRRLEPTEGAYAQPPAGGRAGDGGELKKVLACDLLPGKYTREQRGIAV